MIDKTFLQFPDLYLFLTRRGYEMKLFCFAEGRALKNTPPVNYEALVFLLFRFAF